MKAHPGEPAPRGSARRAALLEVAALFVKLGFTAFGGPAAHIAMMREEVVQRRRWVSDREFLDLLGLTNLIPGPNSTEMAIHLGYVRAGWPGLVAGGAAFIVPAALIVSAFAWAYVTFGSLPQVGWLLYGIKPVVIAVVLQALVGLGRAAVRDPLGWAWAAGVLALYRAGIHEIPLLLGGGALYAAARRGLQRLGTARAASMAVPVGVASEATARSAASEMGRAAAAAAAPTAAASAAGLSAAAGVSAAAVPFSLSTLFLTFLKIGSVLYGSGYVLLAFLRNDFVERLRWLSDPQLLDAVSVGQFTPGPVFTTATFIGYLLGRGPGAVLATLGIFLPSFFFVAAIRPLGPRLRRSPWTSDLLDGVNLAAVSLMAGVMLQLARSALVDPLTWALALAAFAALARLKVNSAWLILAGAGIGLGARLAAGGV